MQKKEMLYEGKAKKMYLTENPDLYIVEYKDDATAFDGVKKETIADKGRLNNAIASHFFTYLNSAKIPTHFVEKLNDREMLVRAAELIPLEVIVRNIAAGNLAKRLGLDEGTPLAKPVIEFNLKDDALHDPWINASHIFSMGIASPDEITTIETITLKINKLLKEYLKKKEILLVDTKLEFGRVNEGVILIDEISPDTSRFWDAGSREKLDKDRFRRDMGGLIEAYQEVLRRLEVSN